MGWKGHMRLGRKSSAAAAPETSSDPAIQTPDAPATSDMKQLDDVPVSAAPKQPEINTDKTKEILTKVDNATKTMEQNIQAASQRGENLDDLQDKTQAVAESSKQFSKNAKTVKKNLWWKNMKMTIIIVLIVIFLIAGIVGVSMMQK